MDRRGELVGDVSLAEIGEALPRRIDVGEADDLRVQHPQRVETHRMGALLAPERRVDDIEMRHALQITAQAIVGQEE